MKLVKLETPGGGIEVVNTSQICRIYKGKQGFVTIVFAGSNEFGHHSVRTMFTDLDHAVDYFTRAANFSPTPRYEGPQ